LLSKQREGKKVRCVYDPAKSPLQRLFLSCVLPAEMQQKLTDVARVLDPICLLNQLVQLQQAVFRCAASCSPFVPNTPSAPLCIFCVDDCMTGMLPVEGSAPDPEPTFHTLYREQERRKRILGWRRTHKDPFEGEWEQTYSWLVANPDRSGGDIFPRVAAPLSWPLSPITNPHTPARHAENTSLPDGNVGGAMARGRDPGTSILASFRKMSRQSIQADID
jgi:hypothetical protein